MQSKLIQKGELLIAFDGMVTDTLRNKKKTSTDSNSNIYQDWENKHFPCFYQINLFCSSKIYQTKYHAHYFIMKIPNELEIQLISTRYWL